MAVFYNLTQEVVVQGYLIGAPLGAIAIALTLFFLSTLSKNDLNKQLFLMLMITIPFMILYQLSQIENGFYLPMLKLFVVVMLFPIFTALYNTIRMIFEKIFFKQK